MGNVFQSGGSKAVNKPVHSNGETITTSSSFNANRKSVSLQPVKLDISQHRKSIGSLQPFQPGRPSPDTWIFGVKLQIATERSADYATSTDPKAKLVPCVVRKCCEFLNARCLEEEGIYRIPGNKKNMIEYQFRFDSGEIIDFLDLARVKKQYVDPNDIAGLLTQYFKVLPENLFTEEHSHTFLGISWKELSIEQKIQLIKTLITPLPPIHKETIKMFVNHLALVNKNSKKNHMTAKNLTLCIYGMSPYAPVIFNMIEHFESIFEEKLLNPMEVHHQVQSAPTTPQSDAVFETEVTVTKAQMPKEESTEVPKAAEPKAEEPAAETVAEPKSQEEQILVTLSQPEEHKTLHRRSLSCHALLETPPESSAPVENVESTPVNPEATSEPEVEQ